MLRIMFAAALACALAAASPAHASLADQARQYLGKTASELGLPRSNWCADFINMLLGRRGADRRAISYAHVGAPASPGCTDCVAVIAPGSNGRGYFARHWHVGVVKGYAADGNPLIVSGNHGHRVGEGEYARARVRYWRDVSSIEAPAAQSERQGHARAHVRRAHRHVRRHRLARRAHPHAHRRRA